MPAAKPAIDEVELDLGRYELRRRGRRVKLEKKPMELLIFLVGRREQLVTREDIVGKLWRSDLFIDTEPNINNIVRKIRAALGDSPARPRFLETVVGKGYRFVGPMRVLGRAVSANRIPSRNHGLHKARSLISPQRACRACGTSSIHARKYFRRSWYLPWLCRCAGFAFGKSARRGRLADFYGPQPAGRNQPIGSRFARLASALSSTAQSANRKGNGVFRCRCWTLN